MKDNRALLVETNQQRIKAALEEVHSAASRMDSGELKLFAKSQLGEAFLTCADLYGETQELLRSDFRGMTLELLGEKQRKEWERLQKEGMRLRTKWYTEHRLMRLNFERAHQFDVFVHPLYGTVGSIRLKSDEYKRKYDEVPYPTLQEAMYLLTVLKPVPMYMTETRSSKSIQAQEYVDKRMQEKEDEYTSAVPIQPVWLEYKGAVPGHMEFLHVKWETKLDGELWRVEIEIPASHADLISRTYRKVRLRGETVVRDVHFTFNEELREIGSYRTVRWARGSNNSVNELTLYWEED